MALTYASTAKTEADANFAMPSAMTLCLWAKYTALSGTQRLVSHGRMEFFPLNSSGDLELSRTFSTTTGVWRVLAANHGLTLTDWHFVAISLDASNVANDPVCYVAQEGDADIASVTVTDQTTPVGTVDTTSRVYTIGNRSAADRPLAGSMAWVTLYNAVLSESQIRQVAQQGYIATSLLRGYELTSTSGAGGENDLSANNGDATATGSPTTDTAPSLLAVPGGGGMLLLGVG